MLVRFIAVALIGFGLMELSLSWVESSARHVAMRTVDFLFPAILFALGIAGFIKAGSLAAWLSDKLDM